MSSEEEREKKTHEGSSDIEKQFWHKLHFCAMYANLNPFSLYFLASMDSVFPLVFKTLLAIIAGVPCVTLYSSAHIPHFNQYFPENSAARVDSQQQQQSDSFAQGESKDNRESMLNFKICYITFVAIAMRYACVDAFT